MLLLEFDGSEQQSILLPTVVVVLRALAEDRLVSLVVLTVQDHVTCLDVSESEK